MYFLAFWIPEVLAVYSRAIYRLNNGCFSIDRYFCSNRNQAKLHSGPIKLSAVKN